MKEQVTHKVKEKRERIIRVFLYARQVSGRIDGWPYPGGHHTARIMRLLGGSYSAGDSLESMVGQASDRALDDVLNEIEHYESFADHWFQQQNNSELEGEKRVTEYYRIKARDQEKTIQRLRQRVDDLEKALAEKDPPMSKYCYVADKRRKKAEERERTQAEVFQDIADRGYRALEQAVGEAVGAKPIQDWALINETMIELSRHANGRGEDRRQ